MQSSAPRVRTKIVATLGPASRDPAVLRALAEAGADVFRLNFSHGTHVEHAETLARVRALEAELGRPLAVLQDLCGPKLRIGELPQGERILAAGEAAELGPADAAQPARLPCDDAALVAALAPGDAILLGDGVVELRVTATDGRVARLEVVQDGRVASRQGLHVPGGAATLPALTAKDLADLDWAATHRPDFLALSFVRAAADVRALREEMRARGIEAGVVAKIEKPEALAQLGAILAESDAVMVARGDLGVEMDVALVPAAQKKIVGAARAAGRPVIVATQMLESMVTSARPTRAEASDVFNAVLDGADAVMLSGETAAGAHPVAAVDVMNRICDEADAFPRHEALAAREADASVTAVTDAIVGAAAAVVERLDAPLVTVATRTGRTALAVSARRLRARVLALTDDARVARRLVLAWGVEPVHAADAFEPERAMQEAERWAAEHGVATGRPVVLVLGTRTGGGAHDALLVRSLGSGAGLR